MPLIYRDRHSSGTQFDIVSGEVVIGNLWKAILSVTAGQAVYWHWTFHSGPTDKPHGAADSLDDAKAMIEELWAEWLKVAGLTERN
jgi:hypothetical protein